MINDREQQLLDLFECLDDLKTWQRCVLLAAVKSKELEGREVKNVHLLLGDSSQRITTAIATLEQFVSEAHAYWFQNANPVFVPSELGSFVLSDYSSAKAREVAWDFNCEGKRQTSDRIDLSQNNPESSLAPFPGNDALWKDRTDPPG